MNYALQEPSSKPGRAKLRGKKKKPKKPSLTNCGFRRHSPKIPPIIEQTCAYLESKALQHEGLFRVSGSQESIRNYKDRFEKGKKVDLTKELNPNTVAGVLKLFFTELINPIMTYELYPALVSAMSVTETDLCVWCLRQVMDVMPPGNREVIRRITSMFRTISQFESDNKMSARNIALVMNPALFRDPVGSMRDFVKNGGIRVRLVEMFITHHDDIFQLPRAALDERIRMISDGITEKTELLLLEFSQTLQQNAISLATALMNEGETELVVCFENINNLKQSIEAWREGHTGAVQEDFEEDTRVNAKVRRTTSEDPNYSSQLSSPTLQRIKVDRNHSDVNVLTTSKSAQALLPEEYETFEIEETGEGEESTVFQSIEATEDAATSPTSLKKTDIKLLPPPVFLKSSESEVRLRRRRPTGKPKRKREFDASSDSVNGEAAAEVESVESTPNNTSESRISPRSSVRLFFDGRDTKVLADESNIDIGKLFQYVVDGKPEKIREALDSTEPEARFLLIFRLQRAARDFIVALDECK